MLCLCLHLYTHQLKFFPLGCTFVAFLWAYSNKVTDCSCHASLSRPECIHPLYSSNQSFSGVVDGVITSAFVVKVRRKERGPPLMLVLVDIATVQNVNGVRRVRWLLRILSDRSSRLFVVLAKDVHKTLTID